MESKFKTQADIWRYLLESEANRVASRGFTVGLSNGSIFNYTSEVSIVVNFDNPNEWEKYIEPEKCWLDEVFSLETYQYGRLNALQNRAAATSLAREAIKRIEADNSGNWSCNRAIKVLKDLIGESK